jgi:tol-pal system protein YbgF
MRRSGLRSIVTDLLAPLIMGLFLSGCAKHSDFVDIREELRAAVKTQDQEQKRLEGLTRRVQTLEAVKEKDADPLRQRLDDLAARLGKLENRMAKLEESPGSGTPSLSSKVEPPPATDFGKSIKPSKPSPAPEAGTLLPGVPGLSPTSAFNLAYNDYLNGRYDMAVIGFQKFVKDFPTASLVPNGYYWLGESYYNLKDYVRAIQAYEQVVTEHPGSEKVPAALYKIGLSASETGDTGKAKKYLKRVVEEYAISEEAKLAKNRLAELR